MKTLLHRTLQAILDAEVTALSDAADGHGSPLRSLFGTGEKRRLTTRLGVITLRLPESGRVRYLSPLFARYGQNETSFLLLLGRVIVRGWAAPAVVQDFTDRLCGHRFAAEQVQRVAAEIDRELPNFFQREFDREHGYRVPPPVRPFATAPRAMHA